MKIKKKIERLIFARMRVKPPRQCLWRVPGVSWRCPGRGRLLKQTHYSPGRDHPCPAQNIQRDAEQTSVGVSGDHEIDHIPQKYSGAVGRRQQRDAESPASQASAIPGNMLQWP